MYSLETIIFELDHSLLITSYKNHHLFGGHDASAMVRPLKGQKSKFKINLCYRTYMIEMLNQLKSEENQG